MHLSTLKMPENFGLDWPCPSISFLISKPILYQSEKNVICVIFVVYTWVRSPVSSHPPICCLCGVTCKLKALSGVTEVSIFRHSISTQYFDRIITICVNAYRKRTVRTVLTNMWHQIRQYRTRLQKTLNTGRNPTARTRPQHRPTFWHSSALGYFPSKFPPNETL